LGLFVIISSVDISVRRLLMARVALAVVCALWHFSNKRTIVIFRFLHKYFVARNVQCCYIFLCFLCSAFIVFWVDKWMDRCMDSLFVMSVLLLIPFQHVISNAGAVVQLCAVEDNLMIMMT